MDLPRNEQGPQRLGSVPLFGNLHLANRFEDNKISGQQVLDLLALEDLSTAGPHSAAEGPTGASVLTSCATSSLLLICRPTVRSSLSNCWT